VVLGGLAWFLLGGSEPVYQGKTLSEWLKGYDGFFDTLVGDNEESDEAIRHIGTNALPFLEKMLVAKDSKFKVKVMNLADKQSLFKFHFTTALHTRAMAYCGLRALGKGAKPMIPILVRSLNDKEEELVFLVAEVLGNIGVDGIECLTNALLNTNLVHRECVAYALGLYRKAENGQDPDKRISEAELARTDHCVIPILVEMLTDTNRSVRVCAIRSLGGIHQLPEFVVPALEAIFKDPKDGFRMQAGFALAEFGDRARSTVPTLLTALNDPDEYTRKAATNALRKIDPEAARKEGIR